MKPILVALACVAALWSQAVVAQTTPTLSPADSASLRLETIAIMLDSLAPDVRKQSRLWIGGGVHLAHARATDVSDTEWLAISQSYTGARRVARTDTVVLCPEGVELRMPGSGCPIRDGGIILEIGPLRIEADSVMTRGRVIRSHSRGDLVDSWALSIRLVFERIQQEWRLRAIRSRGVT